jgi:hypothetical protein
MLTTPVFAPWRPLWDSALGDRTRRLDELASERRKGRRLPPRVSPEVLQVVRQEPVQRLLRGAERPTQREFLRVMAELAPLLRACAWPRWLLLEAALEQASRSGALHVAALVLRTQIEELDALQDVAAVVAPDPKSKWDDDSAIQVLRMLSGRVLPRVRLKSAEELVEAAADPASVARRPERLQMAFDELGDYVHPNYGSHILSVRPHSTEAARILVDAFVAVYEAFLSLPWASEADDADPDAGSRPAEWEKQARLRSAKPPFLVLAEETARALAPAHPFVGDLGPVPWIDAINCFHRKLERDSYHEASALSLESDEARKALAASGVPAVDVDVEATRALREHLDNMSSCPPCQYG